MLKYLKSVVGAVGRIGNWASVAYFLGSILIGQDLAWILMFQVLVAGIFSGILEISLRKEKTYE